MDRKKKFKEFHKKGYFTSPDLPENIGPMTMRFAINYTLFDLFMMTDDVIMFGEDVAWEKADSIDEKSKRVIKTALQKTRDVKESSAEIAISFLSRPTISLKFALRATSSRNLM